MADFRHNCSIANQNCNPANYANYDGWMLGALVYVPLDQPDIGFCFNTSKYCTYVNQKTEGSWTNFNWYTFQYGGGQFDYNRPNQLDVKNSEILPVSYGFSDYSFNADFYFVGTGTLLYQF